MTFTEKAQELMKGCGEVFEHLQCGISYDSRLNPTHNLYCQSCQIKISQMREDFQVFKELVNKRCIGVGKTCIIKKTEKVCTWK